MEWGLRGANDVHGKPLQGALTPTLTHSPLFTNSQDTHTLGRQDGFVVSEWLVWIDTGDWPET